MEGNLLSVRFPLRAEDIFFKQRKIWDTKPSLSTIQKTSHLNNSQKKTLFLLPFMVRMVNRENCKNFYNKSAFHFLAAIIKLA